MKLIEDRSQAGTRNLARSYRYVTAWLIAGAVLALMLFANSIRDYLYVSRILAVQQVRHELSRYVVSLEQKLRRTPASSPSDLLADTTDSAASELLWVEIRRADGAVLARRGPDRPRLFSADEESAHFRDREPLYKIVPASGGETVVEAFPVYGSALAVLPSPPTPAPASPTGRRSPLVVRARRDARAARRLRHLAHPPDLAISCSGALALLTTVVAAGLGFPLIRARPAAGVAGGSRPTGAVRAAPVSNGGLGAHPPGQRLQAGRAGERRFLRRVSRRRRPHRARDGRRLRQGRPRRARHGRHPRRRALERVAGVRARARARVGRAEPPAVRGRIRLALRQHVLVLLRAASAPAVLRQRRTLPAAPRRREGTRGSRSPVSTPAARCWVFFPRLVSSRPGATSVPATCSSSTRMG